MKFRRVNPHNIRWLVPAWAISPFVLAVELDDLLVRYQAKRSPWDAKKKFWLQVEAQDGGWGCSVKEPEDDGTYAEKCGLLIISSDEWVINLPLNEILKGAPEIEGSHCVYMHSFDTEGPLMYFGLTKQRWFDRHAQHRTAAQNGSPYVFHRAMREHDHRRAFHRVMMSFLTEDQAMDFEEEWVGAMSLYPLGLNMIPGGKAGIRYLSKLGVHVINAVGRDAAVERLVCDSTLAGRPNPLCAARWESDPDYNARVICGHSGRLTVEQLRTIRDLASNGVSARQIASGTGDSVRRVANVIAGKRYGRVR